MKMKVYSAKLFLAKLGKITQLIWAGLSLAWSGFISWQSAVKLDQCDSLWTWSSCRKPTYPYLIKLNLCKKFNLKSLTYFWVGFKFFASAETWHKFWFGAPQKIYILEKTTLPHLSKFKPGEEFSLQLLTYFRGMDLYFLHQLKFGKNFDFKALRKVFVLENKLILTQLNSNLVTSAI